MASTIKDASICAPSKGSDEDINFRMLFVVERPQRLSTLTPRYTNGMLCDSDIILTEQRRFSVILKAKLKGV